jgi:hypothetical protein
MRDNGFLAGTGAVMNSRWARVARGITAAGLATFVAAFSHVIAGGAAPSAFGLAASLIISAMLCTMLAGRAVSALRLAISVAASQALFHALFSGLGTPVPTGHDMNSMTVDATTHLHAAPTMWLAHAAAGIVTVVALRYAESAFWGVADTARLLVARLVALVVPRAVTPARPPAVVAAERRAPDLALLLSSMRHRGPPAESCA